MDCGHQMMSNLTHSTFSNQEKKNYPMLLHSQKSEQEVAVRPAVVDVRLKKKVGSL